MPYLIAKINGTSGSIDVPRLGVPIAEMSAWSLTRRGDPKVNGANDPEGNFYDLRATLTRFTQAILDDPEYEKRVILWLKSHRYVVKQAPGERMALMGRSLVMERVELEKWP